MLIWSAVPAASVALVVGVLAYWANPGRRLNRGAFTISLHVTIWLLCRSFAYEAGPNTGVWWLKTTVAVGAFVPAHLAFLFDSILHPDSNAVATVRRLKGWIVVTVILAALVFTNWFIPAESTSENRMVGPGYVVHFSGLLGCYIVLVVQGIISLRGRSGIQRMELKVLLIGGASTAAVVVVLMVVQRLNIVPVHPLLAVVVVLVEFIVVITAITTHRIFEAQYLFLLGVQRILLVLGVAGVIWLFDMVLRSVLPEGFAFIVAVGTALAMIPGLTRGLDRILRRGNEMFDARREAFELARRGVAPDQLRIEFTKVLSNWAQAGNAVLLIKSDDQFIGSGLSIAEDDKLMRGLRKLRWVTPERLIRERSESERLALADFLRGHRLGALVFCEGPILQVAVGIGVRPSRRPFTYPQIQQLQELAAIIETAYARTFLTAKVQRAEQLAHVGLMGASLAHEIRNPLVSIKTFVQLLPTRHDDPLFRERFSSIVGSEVQRIDRLTEQLLDLSSPREYLLEPLALHDLLRVCLELINSRALEAQVAVECRFEAAPDLIHSDSDAVKQVLLNLSFNAIQAQERRAQPRWVRLQTRRVGNRVELSVSDNGPGVPASARAHLFQPFHSTKSSGFGLGLAICAEIVSRLDATVSVDPPVPDEGAIFRVSFPCPPPTS